MTEELKGLCAKLRREYYDGELAASEIERLAAQMKGKPMQYEDQLVIGNVFNTAIQQILAEFEGNADPNLVAALAQGLLVRLDQAGYVIAKK